MLTMHISEHETPTQAAPNPASPDALAACLAQYGGAPRLIQSALATLRQSKTLVLYRPTEADAWEIADAHMTKGVLSTSESPASVHQVGT